MKTKDEQARYLASEHEKIEPSMFAVYRIVAEGNEEDSQEPVKLLEVNDATVPVGIRPVYFGSDPQNEIFFPTVVVEITSDEFQALKSGELQLPDGWRVDAPLAGRF